MKSKFVKAMAAGMAIAAMGGTAMPVFAAGTPTTVYTAVQGKADQATLTKYLVLDSEAKVPTETFAYTITLQRQLQQRQLMRQVLLQSMQAHPHTA